MSDKRAIRRQPDQSEAMGYPTKDKMVVIVDDGSSLGKAQV